MVKLVELAGPLGHSLHKGLYLSRGVFLTSCSLKVSELCFVLCMLNTCNSSHTGLASFAVTAIIGTKWPPGAIEPAYS